MTEIELLYPGAGVLGSNESSTDLAPEPDRVGRVWRGEAQSVDMVELSGGDEIALTANHPVYVLERGWTNAGALILGERVETLEGLQEIVTLRSESGPWEVWNLTVEGTSTFFVGEAGLWVHNCASSKGAPEFPGGDPTKAPKGFEWKGRPGSTLGSKQGNYHNPKTGESLRPDLDHPDPIGPHWDYRDPGGKWWRIKPDGSMDPK